MGLKSDKATGRPWTVVWFDSDNGWIMAREIYLAEIVTSDEEQRCAPPSEQEANARLIVHAVNLHDDLLAALKREHADAAEHGFYYGKPWHSDYVRPADCPTCALIARAEGREA